MRSIKNPPKRLNLYGKTFTVYGDYTVFNINKIPDELKYMFSDDEFCWVEWIGDGVRVSWESVRENIKRGIWVLR